MAFSVRDFHDLMRLLEQHPEWRAELRRLLLTDELIALPQIVRELAEAQKRTEHRLVELAEAQRRTEERLERLEVTVAALAEAQRRTEERLERLEVTVAALAEAQRRTEERLERLEVTVAALAEAQRRTEERLERLEVTVAALAEAQRRTEEEVGRLAREVSRLTVEVGDLKGSDLERRYREKAASFFQGILRRIYLIDHQELGRILDDAVDDGRISVQEKADIMYADVVVRGQRDGQQVYLLAEVSGVVYRADVERAARRAVLLQKAIGAQVLPVVAGQRILAEADEEAKAAGVWRVLDGVVEP